MFMLIFRFIYIMNVCNMYIASVCGVVVWLIAKFKCKNFKTKNKQNCKKNYPYLAAETGVVLFYFIPTCFFLSFFNFFDIFRQDFLVVLPLSACLYLSLWCVPPLYAQYVCLVSVLPNQQ